MKTIAAGVLVAMAVIGCGGGGGGGSVAFADLPNALLEAQCRHAVECDEVPAATTCTATFSETSLELATVQADVTAGVVIYNADKAGDCIDSLEGSCTYDGNQLARSAALCAALFEGTKSTEGLCEINEECVGYATQTAFCQPTDASCDPLTTCCAGTCTEQPALVANGESCASGTCASGLYCTETDQTCQPLVTIEGAPCAGTGGCGGALYCNYDFETMAGACVKPAANGAACDPTSGFPCADQRDYCDMTALKCTADVAVGKACSDNTPCVGYAYCDPTTMICVANPGPGEACEVDGSGGACLGNLVCTNSICTLPTAVAACP